MNLKSSSFSGDNLFRDISLNVVLLVTGSLFRNESQSLFLIETNSGSIDIISVRNILVMCEVLSVDVRVPVQKVIIHILLHFLKGSGIRFIS